MSGDPQPIERWRPIAGYEGFYEVSDRGRVHSIERLDRLGRRVSSRILRANVGDKVGHLAVNLHRDGEVVTRWVHGLVAEAFIPNPKGYPLVRHLDGDPTHNDLANLARGTHAMNYADGQRHGTLRVAQHGTVSKYNNGCRCDACTSAATEYARALRAANPDYAKRQREANRRSARKRALARSNKPEEAS